MEDEMETPKVPVIDKSKWPDGPWKSEPDRVDFEHAGFPCLMLRGQSHGAWCGYVAVPPGHPLHGKDYNDEALGETDVHGGLTYASACSGHICHVPEAGEPADVWWFGFDCIHAGDLAPGHAQYGLDSFSAEYDCYRNAAWVRHEVE